MIVRKNTGDDVDSLLRMAPATGKHTWLLMTSGTIQYITGDDVDSLPCMVPATGKHTWLLMTPGTIQYNTGDDVDSLLRMAPAAGKHTSDASGVIVLSHTHVI